MALFSKKEFAGKCGISTNGLAVYISRSKVIIGEDDLIDDQNALNAQFITKCQSKPKKSKPDSSISEKPQKAQISEKKNKEPDKYDQKFELDTRKRSLEIEKLQREARQEEVTHLKAIGKLIPTDLVKSLFVQTLKAYTMSFKQGADKIVGEYGKRAKMNRNDMAEMRNELINIINKATEEGSAESKKLIGQLVRETQAKGL